MCYWLGIAMEKVRRFRFLAGEIQAQPRESGRVWKYAFNIIQLI
jgi:hypothetical protein